MPHTASLGGSIEAGDVLAYTATNNRIALFRVAGVQRSRFGDFPYLEWLNWTGRKVPRAWRLARLKPAVAPATWSRPKRPIIYTVTRFRKSEVGWQEYGFVHVARLPRWRSEDSLPRHPLSLQAAALGKTHRRPGAGGEGLSGGGNRALHRRDRGGGGDIRRSSEADGSRERWFSEPH